MILSLKFDGIYLREGEEVQFLTLSINKEVLCIKIKVWWLFQGHGGTFSRPSVIFRKSHLL